MKRAAAALSACAALSAPAAARAQDGGEVTALRLAYEASPGCPSAPSFRGQVVARTARVRFAEGEATEHVLFVSLVREPARVVGRLRVDERQGSSLARELSGASCDEVASALALIAALAFDPQAKTAPLPAPPPAAPPLGAPRRPAPERPPPRAPARPAAPAPWHVALGAQARLASGPLPGFWPQAGLFVELASGRRGWLSPSLRAIGVTTWRQSYEGGGGNASFSFAGGRLEGCPARWQLAARLDASPCLGLEAAWLRAQGGFEAGPQDRLWLALEASGRLRWAPAGPFFLEAQAGFGVPLTPYRFLFERPGTSDTYVVHKVGPLGGQLGFSLGLSFLVIPRAEAGHGRGLDDERGERAGERALWLRVPGRGHARRRRAPSAPD